MAAPLPSVTRTSTQMYHSWAEANPKAFADAVIQFHRDHPVEDWRHHIDLSLKFQITLHAVRRAEPFDADRDFLKEIGY